MQTAHVHFREWIGSPRHRPHVTQRREMIDRLQVILQRLAANGDALLDNQGRLDGGQRVPLDRIGRIGQFNILAVLEVAQATGRTATKPVKLGLLVRDALKQLIHVFPRLNQFSFCTGSTCQVRLIFRVI
jgi:hypothetical protein